MGTTPTKTALAYEVINLLHSRFDEAWRLPGGAVQVTRPKADSPDFIVESILLCGRHNGARLERSTFNTFTVHFTNPFRSAYEWEIVGIEEPRVTFYGEDGDCPPLEKQIDKIRRLPIGLNELVPYGWIDGERITTVLYCHGVMNVSTGPLVRSLWHAAFTLEHEELPEPLKVVPGEPAWSTRMWSFIQRGKLLRLSTRINGMIEEGYPVRGVFDGESLPYIMFMDHGWWPPRLVVDRPYVDRLITGETLDPKKYNYGRPHDVVLNNWFR